MTTNMQSPKVLSLQTKIMKMTITSFISYVRLAGMAVCLPLLLFACSKSEVPDKEPDPVEKTQLLLEVSSNEITEGDEVSFTVTANGISTVADIYIGGTKINGTKHIFNESGIFSAVAKNDKYTDSEEIDITVQKTEYQTNVYVVGWERENSGDVAKYWKNGIAHTLKMSSNGVQSYGRSIFVENGVVYVGGAEHLPNNRINAVVWKNGEIETWETATSTGLTNGVSIFSIYKYKGDLYAAGTRLNGYRNNDIYFPLGVGVYWKNGVKQEIGEEIKYYDALSISVDEGGVHIVGSGKENGPKAYYWNNNQKTIINDSYQGYSVFTTNGDVYMTGRGGAPAVQPMYWKNGQPHVLSGHTSPETVIANGIFVDNDDVHVVGWKMNASNKQVAIYWKNNVLQELTDGSHDAIANKVFVSDRDVYIVGYESNGTRNVATCWKNGEAIKLTDGRGHANAFGLVVVKERKEK